MLYLLDANILIQASNNYYPIDRVPEFWEWLIHKANNGHVKMPFEILDEVKNGTKQDLLYDWVRDTDNSRALRLDEDVDRSIVQRVTYEGYANDLTDAELESIGRDPILIAYAVGRNNRCIVTNEFPSQKKRQNRRVPDVCNTFDVPWCNAFTLNNKLDFRTSWQA